MPQKNHHLLPLLAIGFVTLSLALLLFIIAPSASLLPTSSNQLTVATTIFPLSDFVKQIGGDKVQVIPILPPGASPHSFSLTPRQLVELQKARVLFIIGHSLDDWAAQAIARAVNIPLFTVDHNIPLQEFTDLHEDHAEGLAEDPPHEAGNIDPHYWLTVPNARQIALNISAELQAIDPPNASYYSQRTTQYIEQLDRLEQDLQASAQSAPVKEFIAIHDGWSYFARHYGFELVATYEPVEGKSPSINNIRALQQIIRDYDIKTFYTEPQKQSTAATRFFSGDLGLSVKVLDPIGGLPPRDSYLKLMQENMRVLTQSK